MSVFQLPPYTNYANYYIAPFILGDTNLNTLQPEYHIFNGSCGSNTESCFDHIVIDNPGYYVISLSPYMCFSCNPLDHNSGCCALVFGFNITYGLWPADNYKKKQYKYTLIFHRSTVVKKRLL